MTASTIQDLQAGTKRRKAQNHALMSNLLGGFMVFVILGPMMQLYATDVLGLDAKRISYIIGFIPIITMIRFAFLKMIRRHGRLRVLQIGAVIQIILLSISILIPAESITFIMMLGILMAFSLTSQMTAGVVWQPLMRDITTNEDRGQFFSRMRFCFSLTNLFAIGGISLWISGTLSELQYKILLGFCILGFINRIAWSLGIPDHQEPESNTITEKNFNPKEFFARLKSAPLLRLPVLIIMPMTLFTLPMLPVYLREVLNIPAQIIAIAFFMASLGGTASYLIWGKIADAIGFRPMLTGLLILNILTFPLLLLVAPMAEGQMLSLGTLTPSLVLSLGGLFIFMLINGAVFAGTGIATTTIEHYHVSEKNSLEAMNVFALLGQLAVSLAALINGMILAQMEGPNAIYSIVPDILYIDAFRAYRVIFVAVILVGIIFLVRRLPNTKPAYGLDDFFSTLTNSPIRTLVFSRRLYHGDKKKRIKLARFLGQSSNPMGINTLLELSNDPDYDVKVEAIRSLGVSGSTQATPRLIELLQHSRQLADHAAWALGELGDPQAADMLITKLEYENPQRVKAMAARALGNIGDQRARQPILDMMIKTEHLHVVSSSISALVQLDAREHASEIFTASYRLTERSERYEVLVQLCAWMDVPSDWLMKITEQDRPSEMLEVMVSQQSEKWQQDRRHAIEALKARDNRAVAELYNQSIDIDDNHDLQLALSRVLNNADEWGIPCVLGLAFALFRK